MAKQGGGGGVIVECGGTSDGGGGGGGGYEVGQASLCVSFPCVFSSI